MGGRREETGRDAGVMRGREEGKMRVIQQGQHRNFELFLYPNDFVISHFVIICLT